MPPQLLTHIGKCTLLEFNVNLTHNTVANDKLFYFHMLLIISKEMHYPDHYLFIYLNESPSGTVTDLQTD